MRKSPLTLTDKAATRVQELMTASNGKNGLRVGVKNTGCSGLSYVMDYADEPGPFDEVMESNGVKLFIESKSLMFLLGTQMDYVEGDFGSHFTFTNPNETGRCGCGESFSVDREALAKQIAESAS